MQCFAKSLDSVAVQSPLDFSFISTHHSSLPILGAQAVRKKITDNKLITFFIDYPNLINMWCKNNASLRGKRLLVKMSDKEQKPIVNFLLY